MRAALRSLRHAPGFSLVVIATLGVALGANIALFSAADALLFRALPYSQSERLVTLFETEPASGARALVSAPNFLDWKSSSRAISAMAAFRPWGFVLTGSGDAERLAGARVSADLLTVLGVNPAIGRGFRPDEDVHGGPAVVLVSDGFWRRRLGASSDLTEQRLVLNGVPHQVVGVLPAHFKLPAADVLVPLALEPFALTQRGNRALTVIGRLAADATIDRARTEIAGLARDSAAQSPAAAGWGAGAVSLVDHLTGRIRPTLLLIWTVVVIVLLVACANTTGLILVRMAARRDEIAIYAALGAGRAWIARRLVSESLLLGLAAGILGLSLAMLFLKIFTAVAPSELSRLTDATIDVRTAVFALALSIAAGTLAGILPAVRSARGDLSPALRAARSTGARQQRVGGAAVAGQVGLAMVVLMGAGLLVRSFERVMAVSPGFDPSRVLSLSVSPDATYADPQRRVAFFGELLVRLTALPGVEAAGIMSHPPLTGPPLTADVTGPSRALATYSVVGGEWFRAMGVPLRRGRLFGAMDRMGAHPVVIVSENFARAMWPGADPIGRRIVVGGTLGADPQPREIVGVAGDVRTTLEADAPFHIYAPYAQNPWPTMGVAVRTSTDPGALTAAVRAAIASLDRNQAVYNARPFDQVVGRAVAPRRFQALIVSLFALLAVALAATGVYTVVAYTVRLRTPEIGVRLALGASRRSVVGLALRDALAWSIAGLAAGLCIALLSARTVEGLLFGVRPTDAGTVAVTGSVMIALVLSASILAAWRAARVDPIVALRSR
jgi:putative ABC transport system permease protein